MAAIDPVSCLLCLDAFERPTMLRIHLRPIGGGDPREYYLCQRCGGAIAAEYLYVQETGKTEAGTRTIEVHADDIDETGDHIAHDHEPGIMQPPLEEAAAGVGEVTNTEIRDNPAESPSRRKKEGRKDT